MIPIDATLISRSRPGGIQVSTAASGWLAAEEAESEEAPVRSATGVARPCAGHVHGTAQTSRLPDHAPRYGSAESGCGFRLNTGVGVGPSRFSL